MATIAVLLNQPLLPSPTSFTVSSRLKKESRSILIWKTQWTTHLSLVSRFAMASMGHVLPLKSANGENPNDQAYQSQEVHPSMANL